MTPANAFDRLLDLVALGPQHGQVGTVGADDDRRARAGQHFLDPLLEIGQQVAIQARIAIDGCLNFLHRRRQVVLSDRR